MADEIKNEKVATFHAEELSARNTVRTILLFGRNTATYKFALCDALLKQPANSSVSYDDLAPDFLKAFVEHYRVNPHQFKGQSNAVTAAVDTFLKTDESQAEFDSLVSTTRLKVYRYVFDAFHNVGRGTIQDSFRLFENNATSKELVLTESLHSILENRAVKEALHLENQARWRLVEEAWKAGLAQNVLIYNQHSRCFDSVVDERRTNLRSAVDVLLPYQHGRCFYCGRPLDRGASSCEDAFPDVDHFFPWALMVRHPEITFNPDGVWNLVLACKQCNRGPSGKFDIPPSSKFFQALLTRNLLFVEEHRHSLRNAILMSLNSSNSADVARKMRAVYKVLEVLQAWEPSDYYED